LGSKQSQQPSQFDGPQLGFVLVQSPPPDDVGEHTWLGPLQSWQIWPLVPQAHESHPRRHSSEYGSQQPLQLSGPHLGTKVHAPTLASQLPPLYVQSSHE
jgi:hypothetical protein